MREVQIHRIFRSVEKVSAFGSALPIVWKAFEQNEVNFYRGEMSMIASPPGTGKSALALNYAVKAKVPTLYISCDMGRGLVSRRVAAVLSDTPVNQVREEMEGDEGREKYTELLVSVDHLYASYPSRPNAEGLVTQLLAFQEFYGTPPQLLCLDNLMNMSSGQENEWAGLRDLCQVLHWIATEYQSHVMVLHHLNMGGLDLLTPADITSIKGQVTELPGLVLTLSKGLRVAPVKNRNGKADPTGRMWFSLDFDESRQTISDPMPKEPRQEVKRDTPDWFARSFKDD